MDLQFIQLLLSADILKYTKRFVYNGHYRGPLSRGQPHPPDFNDCDPQYRTEGHRESRNEVGSQSPAKRLAGLESGTL